MLGFLGAALVITIVIYRLISYIIDQKVHKTAAIVGESVHEVIERPSVATYDFIFYMGLISGSPMLMWATYSVVVASQQDVGFAFIFLQPFERPIDLLLRLDAATLALFTGLLAWLFRAHNRAGLQRIRSRFQVFHWDGFLGQFVTQKEHQRVDVIEEPSQGAWTPELVSYLKERGMIVDYKKGSPKLGTQPDGDRTPIFYGYAEEQLSQLLEIKEPEDV